MGHIGLDAFRLLERAEEAEEENARVRTLLSLVEKRLVEFQHEADDFGAKTLGTKVYALRQTLQKAGGVSTGE